jgi:hypothetical protein
MGYQNLRGLWRVNTKMNDQSGKKAKSRALGLGFVITATFRIGGIVTRCPGYDKGIFKG